MLHASDVAPSGGRAYSTLNAATTSTPKDANGLYNGCPAPVNCWIPQVVDGQEWFPIGQE